MEQVIWLVFLGGFAVFFILAKTWSTRGAAGLRGGRAATPASARHLS